MKHELFLAVLLAITNVTLINVTTRLTIATTAVGREKTWHEEQKAKGKEKQQIAD